MVTLIDSITAVEFLMKSPIPCHNEGINHLLIGISLTATEWSYSYIVYFIAEFNLGVVYLVSRPK